MRFDMLIIIKSHILLYLIYCKTKIFLTFAFTIDETYLISIYTLLIICQKYSIILPLLYLILLTVMVNHK